MYNNYKIVCNTAAGRRRYMQYLLPPILASDIIDRYDIWINTVDACDIEFFKLIAQKYPKVNLVWQPDGIVDGINSINAFYRACVEENTIYLKMDDDIIWTEPDFFEKMVAFRVNNPGYFLVSPMVINNALSSYILQISGKLKLSKYMNARANHSILWRSGEFAFELHDWFLKTQLPDARYRQLYCGKRPIAMNRFSINSILWFGKDMKEFNGIIPGDDEEYLSCIKPTELGLTNCFNGDTIVSHFSFYSQREYLDRENILERYGKHLHHEWSKIPKMEQIDKTVQAILNDIESKKSEIIQNPVPYKTAPVPTKKQWELKFKQFTRMLKHRKYKPNNTKHIVV